MSPQVRQKILAELVVLELDALGRLTKGHFAFGPREGRVQSCLPFQLDLSPTAGLDLLVREHELLNNTVNGQPAMSVYPAANAHNHRVMPIVRDAESVESQEVLVGATTIAGEDLLARGERIAAGCRDAEVGGRVIEAPPAIVFILRCHIFLILGDLFLFGHYLSFDVAHLLYQPALCFWELQLFTFSLNSGGWILLFLLFRLLLLCLFLLVVVLSILLFFSSGRLLLRFRRPLVIFVVLLATVCRVVA